MHPRWLGFSVGSPSIGKMNGGGGVLAPLASEGGGGGGERKKSLDELRIRPRSSPPPTLAPRVRSCLAMSLGKYAEPAVAHLESYLSARQVYRLEAAVCMLRCGPISTPRPPPGCVRVGPQPGNRSIYTSCARRAAATNGRLGRCGGGGGGGGRWQEA